MKALHNVPQQGALPIEAIYWIVSHLIASFLDDLLEGPLPLDVDMDSQIGRDDRSSTEQTYVATVPRRLSCFISYMLIL